jgi:HK97 family phage major capsid protein
MKIGDQIRALQRQRTKLIDDMSRMNDALATEGEGDGEVISVRVFTEDERREYTKLEGQVKDIDEQLVRLLAHEARQAASALPLAHPLNPTPDVEVRTFKPFPGQELARYVMAMAASKGNLMQALEIAKRWDNETPNVTHVLRAAVAAGTTTDPAWAGPLVYYQNLVSDFIEFLRPLTIFGQLSGYRTIPFNVRIPRQTAGSTAQWVGEGLSKPVSALAFDAITVPWTKLAVIIVITQELARFSNPSAEMMVRDDMANAIAAAIDTSFISNAAAVAGVRPAGINNASPNIASTGNTFAAVQNDLIAAQLAMGVASINMVRPVWIMSLQAAAFIGSLLNALGQPAFPGMQGAYGQPGQRTLMGIPVIASGYIVPSGGPPTTSSITLLEQSELMVADDGQVTFDASQEASLQMDSAPATPPTSLVSLWQQNLLGVKAERFIYWLMRRAAAVQEITGFPQGGTPFTLSAAMPPDAPLPGAGGDSQRPRAEVLATTHGAEGTEHHARNRRT